MANRYWRLREEQNREQNIQGEKAYDREINSIYEQAFDEIQDEINSFYGKYARKEGISMAEAKKRVSRLDIEEYERKAARYVAEKNFSDKANEEMRLYNTTMKINRLEMLKSDIALRLTGAADKADKYSGKVLTEATRKELERQAGILGGTVHASNTQMAEKIVKSPFRNATYSERVWNNASTIQYDLEKELRRTLIQGKAMDFSRLGPFAKCQERAKADARRLLKTELVRCRSEAQKAEYEENGFDEYEFMCLGSHPCEICQGLNGKHFPVRDLAKNMGEFAPPIHPNCRCTTAPWVDEDAYNNWLNAKADGSFSGGFDEWKNGIINTEIDELTPCLRNLKTGEIVQTTVKEITPKKGQFKDWEFDWTLPQKDGFKVFALYADGDERIQGLVATKPVKENIAIKIDIVESAPFNNKHNPINTAHKKEYSGVGGHLFAEAVKQSYENGFDGFVYFQAKTNLINHYIKALGAEEIANNRTMSISGKEARVLYEKYYGKK